MMLKYIVITIYLVKLKAIEIYSNPTDTLHFCFSDNTRIVLKGKDNYLYKTDDGKNSYSRPVHEDSCYYIKHYLTSLSSQECSLSQIKDTKFLYPMYQKGGCFLAIDSLTQFDHYTQLIETHLEQTCSNCLENSIIYSKLESSQESVYPIDTSHYCLNNQVIQVQGYDNVGFSSHSRSSKSQYGKIEPLDSCYYIRQFFKQEMYSRCLDKNITNNRQYATLFFPIRHFGNCYVSAKNVNSTQLTYNLIDYLDEIGCRGCRQGDYTIIDASPALPIYNLQLSYLIILIILVIESVY